MARFGAFQDFACNRNGNSLRRRIYGMAHHYVSGHAAKIDANWHSINIQFEDCNGPHSRLLGHPLTDKDACRVEFDYRPSLVFLVGPRVGQVDLTEEIFRMIPEPLFALMRMCDVLKPWFHDLYNRKHVIEIIENKTVVYFENCMSGVVRNVNGDEFDVELFHGDFNYTPEGIEHYTRSRLLEDMEMEGLHGQAVDVRYFPFLPQEGRTFETAEDVREWDRTIRERRMDAQAALSK